MFEVSELLRQAVPEPSVVDIEAIRTRATHRRRRRRIAIASAAACVAVVVAAVVLRPDHPQERSQVTTVPDGPRVPATTEASADTPQRLPLEATRVAASPNGNLWALVAESDGQSVVQQLDPSTGDALVRVSGLASETSFLAAGDEFVLAGFGGDGAYPDGHLDIIQPAGGVIGSFDVSGGGPYAAAFRGGTAWVTTGANGEVRRIRPGEREQIVKVGGQTTDVLALEDGDVWVRDSAGGRIVRLDGTTMKQLEVVKWDYRLLASSERSFAWVSDAPRGLLFMSLADGAHSPAITIPTGMPLPNVALSPEAVYVYGQNGVEQWPHHAEPSTPTATTPARDVQSLVVVHGSVWFVSGGGGGGLWRWQPTAPPSAPQLAKTDGLLKRLDPPEANGLPQEVNTLLATCVEGQPLGLARGRNLADIPGTAFTRHGGIFTEIGKAWNSGRCADMRTLLRLVYGELIPAG